MAFNDRSRQYGTSETDSCVGSIARNCGNTYGVAGSILYFGVHDHNHIAVCGVGMASAEGWQVMNIYSKSAAPSLEIVRKINTAKSIVGLDSLFIICVDGIDFVGQFTMHNEREYITLQNPITKEIYHDLRFEAGNIHTLIDWIFAEVNCSNL
jgi:hypothetical protein